MSGVADAGGDAGAEPALRLEPWDEHNRLLISRVHPPDWVNPTPRERYHLVVLGAGSGGLVSASIAAALGARVALVERHLMGGDCLNFGCVPSKALLRAAAWRAAARPTAGAGDGAGEFEHAMERMRRIRAEIAQHDSAERFRGLGVDVFLGEGRFESGDTLLAEDAPLRFRRAIVATGARPFVPPIPGLHEAGHLTTETVFGLTRLPRRLAIVGGGPIGVELAQAFGRLGSEVILIEEQGRLLIREDPDVGTIIREALERDGVRVSCGATIRQVARDGDTRILSVEHAAGAQRIQVNEVLVAAGRTPIVEGLGLEAAGIQATPAGILTDARLRTSNRRIYAIGDATGGPGYTHRSDAHARLAVRNALFWGRGRADRLVIPWCTFTDPEVAHVGLTSAEADRRPDEVVTLTVPAGAIDRTRLDGSGEGFLRLHLRDSDDTILGATVVHPQAGELIAVAVQAIAARTPLSVLGEAVLPYPTGAELYRRAADVRRRRRLTPRTRKVFEMYFRFFR